VKQTNQTSAKRRWFLLGPGTILALVVGVAIVATNRLANRPPADPNAGRIVYEADAQGRMRRVTTPSTVRRPLPRPWKPEVSLLLERASVLKLDAGQIKELTALNSAWLREKAALLHEIERAASGARPQGSASASQITAGLGDYSRLSQQYNERRANYWRRAVAKLTGEQVQTFDRLTDAARKGDAL
jgi:hypothetical protein